MFCWLSMFGSIAYTCDDFAVRVAVWGSRRTQADMLDSEAVFESRASEIGLNAAEIGRAKTLNVASFGKLAFAANYTPGQADEAPLLAMMANICGVDPAPADRAPLIRRLFFESYTLAAADLRSRLEKREDDQPRKLAQAERAARYTAQVNRLTGLDLVGELEPSHGLVDLVFQLVEENQIKYIRWEQCIKRDHELMGLKHDPLWKPDSQGVIREVRVQSEIKADTSSDLRLKYALQRRSLALDQARLIDYEKMEKWSSVLLEAYSKAPLDGYRRVTIEQIQHADMELFKMLIKMTRNGIRPVHGVAPLEAALEKIISLPEVRLHLQPLPCASGAAKRKADPEDEDRAEEPKSKQTKGNEKLRRTIENLNGQIKNLRRNNKGSGKGSKGKRGNNATHSTVRMPSELIGQNAMTSAGDPICFSFNMSGCKQAKVGERCSKGYHQCSKCGGPHSQRSCNNQ